jgi:hypothetical protein
LLSSVISETKRSLKQHCPSSASVAGPMVSMSGDLCTVIPLALHMWFEL